MRVDKILISLSCSSVVMNAAIAIVGPYLPGAGKDKGIDTKVLGYLFAIYPLCFVIGSLILPHFMKHLARRFVLCLSTILYGAATIGFGCLVWLEPYHFIWVGLLLRAIQGAMCAAIFTTSYSIFSLMYKGEQLHTVNSFFKATIGIGNIVGLFFGTFLYMYGGYPLPFIVYGVTFIAITPLNFLMIPANIDEHIQ